MRGIVAHDVYLFLDSILLYESVACIYEKRPIYTHRHIYIEMRGIVSHGVYLCLDPILLYESVACIYEKRPIYIHRLIYR